MATHWTRVHHRNHLALQLADRHYSRQHPGTPEFTRPGNKIVLVQFGPDGEPWALWASQRPAPGSGAVRADGRDAWDCSMFRIEHRSVPASALIREAVAITRGVWTDVLPQDGFMTTVNPKHVTPIKRRGEDCYGYCYIKAGWTVEPERTKTRSLVVLTLPLVQLLATPPLVAAWYAPLLQEAMS